jgi:hypothetical protein
MTISSSGVPSTVMVCQPIAILMIESLVVLVVGSIVADHVVTWLAISISLRTSDHDVDHVDMLPVDPVVVVAVRPAVMIDPF